MLSVAVQTYIDRKRALGHSYQGRGYVLKSLLKKIGDEPLEQITTAEVSSFLDARQSRTSSWRVKYGLLRGFFEYWEAREHLRALPLPPMRAPVPSTFVPYVYSREELKLLLRGTRTSQTNRDYLVDAPTFRTLLLFLYATGTLKSEALRLQCADVDLRRGAITVRGDWPARTRVLPIGSDLQDTLRKYINSPSRKAIKSDYFFPTRLGRGINAANILKRFQRLRRVVGATRPDTSPFQPRLHDLRHTFAVHRITAWYRSGADVNRLLPALSAYLGQHLCSAERYLSLSPERFRKPLDMLSPPRLHATNWRNSPKLMKFLAEL